MNNVIEEQCDWCKNIRKIKKIRLKILRRQKNRFLCDECKKKNKNIMSREDSKRRRNLGQDLISIKCKICGGLTETKKYKYKSHIKKGGIICKKCISKASSKRLGEIKMGQSKEERIKHSKYARSKVKNSSDAVRTQWETIKADKGLLKTVCDARSKRMKKVWTLYDEEKKERIITALTGSKGKNRSMASDNLKKMMIENGMIEFESEKYFHGFFPDEINHGLKIIVEFYGEVYHCNPTRYHDENKFITFIGRTVGEQWKRDRKRLGCFYKHGYTVVIIWEKDFKNNPQREIERIKDEINKKRISCQQ